jgi:hypothetical protein
MRKRTRAEKTPIFCQIALTIDFDENKPNRQPIEKIGIYY